MSEEAESFIKLLDEMIDTLKKYDDRLSDYIGFVPEAYDVREAVRELIRTLREAREDVV